MSGTATQGFCFPVRVYYEDTDAAGVVYYANYLRYMERARAEWLSALGMEIAVLEREHAVAFVVHRVDIRYLQPARLGDRLEVGVTVRELGRSRLILDQSVTRAGDTVTDARVTLVCLHPAQWRAVRIPLPLLARLQQHA
ncbi:MAG: tol-pal system-associated acyl-CoA thioesterase [Betaproteobacteria bacterium]